MVKPGRHAEQVTFGVAKAVVALSLALVLSILPLHDEWKFELSSRCGTQQASACKALFLTCQSYGTSAILNPTPAPGARAAGAVSTAKCFNERYSPTCASACGMPRSTGTWWGRLQAYGPWYLKLFPGARSWWQRSWGNANADELLF
jgi:hypothetical protein